jgi:hypothetical protein
MGGETANARGGNLYSPWTLQGNWYEDRVQGSVGSNDGLRCAEMAYKEMMEKATVYQGPTSEVSMPATQFGTVTTQEPSVKLFECIRYKHPRPLPTNRVLATYNVAPSFRMATTAMLMAHGEKRLYTRDPRKPMVDATNMKETLKDRATSLPDRGFGALLPRFESDADLGNRYWETSSRVSYVNKSGRRPTSPPRDALSSHPNPPHSPTMNEQDKGTDEDKGAGFNYDPSTAYNPMPFPSKNVDGGDPWGRTKASKKGLFGRHHVTSTIRMFVDSRGIDPPRLGITIPNDTTVWPREPGMPKPQARKCLIAYAPQDNQMRRTGVHIWDDYEGL